MKNGKKNLIHFGAFRNGLIGTSLLGIFIFVGSRSLADFDSALVGYTFGCLFSLFGVIYHYSVWLSKPSTKKFWLRGLQLFFSFEQWKNLKAPKIAIKNFFSKMIVQDFIFRRSAFRWSAHMLIASGCTLAAAITFPLVFGWIHFEQGAIGANASYNVIFFGQKVQELPLKGLQSWLIFHGLVISSFLVIPGTIMAIYRRISDFGTNSVQRFGRDLLPLIMLFAIAFSGLLLWVNYEWLDGYYYSVLAQFHAIVVIGTLIYLPFGKLFHIFQRPASLGISFYKTINDETQQAICPVTKESFAPQIHVNDLDDVLIEMAFDYSDTNNTNRHWNEISPEGRRKLIGKAHSKLLGGKFSKVIE
jgi:nitrate reductase gamma subunit